MKKLFLKFSIIAVLFASLSSCDEDTVIFSGTGANSLAAFDQEQGALPAVDATTTTMIVVNVADASPTERTIMISIDPATTALPAEYEIISTSLVIPANAYNGTIIVRAKYEALLDGVSKKLILNLDSVADALVSERQFTLNIFKFCAFERDNFLGEWIANEVGFGPYPSTFTVGTTADNEILMSGIWGVDPTSQTRVFFNDTNAASFVLSFPPYLENLLVPSYGTFGAAYIDRGVGTFSACDQTITMTFQVRVTAGFFAPTTINFYRP
jgi:hypothetical protein